MPKYPRAPQFWEDVIAKYRDKHGITGNLQAKDVLNRYEEVTGKEVRNEQSWSSAWSRIIHGNGEVPETYRDGLLKVFEGCIDLKEFNRLYSEHYVSNIENWNPVIGTFHWPPFCDVKGEEGFLVDATRRFFRLAGKHTHKYENKPLAELLSGEGGIHLSLALAETITRTQTVTTFHTPGRIGINLVGRFDADHFTHARAVLTNGRLTNEKKSRGRVRVITVKDEVGFEYIRSLSPDIIERHDLEALPDTQLSKKIKDLVESDDHWLFCADELTCLHKLQPLKDSHPCLLFPLATQQVTRSEQYARLPGYKIGLFTVPDFQDEVVAFLRKALRVYLENEHEETAQQYAELYRKLVAVVVSSIESLRQDARDYLVRAHIGCKDDFYTGVDYVRVLADRWSRETLQLNPGEAHQALNLPWNPILNRARSLGQVGPIANESRTPGERRAAVTYRELPPVINVGADGVADFSIFGAVLETLRPHVDIMKADRYKRSQTQSQLGSDNPATVAVGFFAVPPRLFDWRFFCFPIRLRFAGVLLGHAGPEHLRECQSILRLLEGGQCGQAIEPKLVRILILNHGAAHNLLRDRGLNGDLFRMIDDTDQDRGDAFLAEVKREPDRPAVVIADEITCLAVAGAHGKWPVQLLNHRLGDVTEGSDGARGVSYFSIAVRSSAPDWVRFFEQAIPLTLELYRERIAEAHKDLFWKLREWAMERAASAEPGRVEKWCRSVLLLDRPDSLSPEWKPVLERAAELTAAGAGV